MRKQMEGDSKQRRKNARKAREADAAPSDHGLTTGASKQRTHVAGNQGAPERLTTIQRGEAKQAGDDVPRPLRGKGRRKGPAVPPKP